MQNQDKTTMELYFEALNDGVQIKDKTMRKTYVEDLDNLWAKETLSEEMKLRMAKQGLHQALFYQEMVEEYNKVAAPKPTINNLEDYTMWAMDKVERALER